VRAEIAFFSRVIYGIDKDCVIGTSRHARFATDAD